MRTMVCTFFGHSDCYANISPVLLPILRQLVGEGVDTFLVGNHGGFDGKVYAALRRLKEELPAIQYHVILAYPPGRQEEFPAYPPEVTLCPEGVENGPPRFAITRRNRWMVEQADVVITYITHPWGGAAQFVRMAERRGKRIIHLAPLLEE
ncbi:MAG: hypothetical protein IJC43_04595 [Clostridia bacterium]|nr:hypothetical protein [Clostridia bacterium]